MSSKKKKQQNIKVTISKILLMVIICLAYYLYELYQEKQNVSITPVNSELSFSVIDVGQGSSTLIQTEGQAMLVDCGEKKASSAVISFIKEQNIEKLDTLVITHLHTDHYGGAINLLKEIPVDTIILPYTPKKLIPTAKSYTQLLDAIKGNGSKTFVLDTISNTNFGSCKINYLDGYLSDDAPDLNNTSLCLRFDFGEASFLITGDAESQEKRLVELNDCNVDVYVAGHHGSRTSSSLELLNEVTPSVIAISCGIDNSYGHPHKETMEKFAKLNVPIYRTDQNGNLIFTTDGETIKIMDKSFDAAA